MAKKQRTKRAASARRESWRDRIEVRRSPIHGKGVFATATIQKGWKVGVFEGELTDEDGMHVLWLLDDDDEWIGIRVTNLMKFANHSSEPNCEVHGDELYALRTIRAGEEITFHYGDEWE